MTVNNPMIDDGFSALTRQWNLPGDSRARSYKLSDHCNTCMPQTPFKDGKGCTPETCFCDERNDPTFQCPHYRPYGDAPIPSALNVHVSFVTPKQFGTFENNPASWQFKMS